MKVDKTTLENIAHLARLKFEEEDAEKMMGDMNNILTWVEINALREDVLKPHMKREDALKNAPKKDANYFRVPKVLE